VVIGEVVIRYILLSMLPALRGTSDGPELKFFDTSLNFTIAGFPGFWYTLNDIPQGIGQSERIGNMIRVRGALRWEVDCVMPLASLISFAVEESQRSVECWVCYSTYGCGAGFYLSSGAGGG